MFHASFQVFPLALDAAGAVELSALMPSDPSLLGTPPVFLSAGAFLSGGVGLSKTVPIWFAQRGAWAPTGKLSAPRGFLQATALGEGPA